MNQKSYERLSYVNVYLTEAVHLLEQLAIEFELDDVVLRLMTEQIEEVRRDANCWLANEFLNDEVQRMRMSNSRNWRLVELSQANRQRKEPPEGGSL